MDYGHPVQHGVHPQQNQPAPRLQTVNYNHGQHRPVASASGSSSTIHVNPHFKGPISMNQPVSRRPLEEVNYSRVRNLKFATYLKFATCRNTNGIPAAKRGYYGFIIVVVLVRVRRDFLLATYSPHFFPDFFHIWQVA